MRTYEQLADALLRAAEILSAFAVSRVDDLLLELEDAADRLRAMHTIPQDVLLIAEALEADVSPYSSSLNNKMWAEAALTLRAQAAWIKELEKELSAARCTSKSNG